MPVPVVTAVPSVTQFRKGHGVRGRSFVAVTEPSQLVMVVATVKVPIDVSRYRAAVLRLAAGRCFPVTARHSGHGSGRHRGADVIELPWARGGGTTGYRGFDRRDDRGRTRGGDRGVPCP